MEKRIRDRDRYEKDVERTVRNTSWPELVVALYHSV